MICSCSPPLQQMGSTSKQIERELWKYIDDPNISKANANYMQIGRLDTSAVQKGSNEKHAPSTG